jgi:hypothetical protein
MCDRRPALYHWEDMDAYQCMGCLELIEVPKYAVLKVSGVLDRVPVKNQPENRMLWLELYELDHAKCHEFKDVEKAQLAREHRSERSRRTLIGMPHCGGKSGSDASKIA